MKILNGDVWRADPGTEDWEIPRRSEAVLGAMLNLESPEGTSWNVREGGADWTLAGRSVSARGDGRVSFRGPASIVDLYLDGYPERLIPYMPDQKPKSGAHTVGDLRVEGVVTALPGTKAVLVELKEGDRHYAYTSPGPRPRRARGPRSWSAPWAPGPPPAT